LNTDILDAGMIAGPSCGDPPPLPDGETPASSTAMLTGQPVSDTTGVSADELTISIVNGPTSNTSTASRNAVYNTPVHTNSIG
jgi:hypothetical protein